LEVPIEGIAMVHVDELGAVEIFWMAGILSQCDLIRKTTKQTMFVNGIEMFFG
jgi:hypothetical protein